MARTKAPGPCLRVSSGVGRRFVLGRQGLWPGRRWKGKEGVRAALREVGQVQVDPLDVVGRSHDLALSSRVEGYRPAYLQEELYVRRSLFEWGGNLQIRPMEELPFLLGKMAETGRHPRWSHFARGHGPLIDRVYREVERRGPMASRDLPESENVESYRARKAAGLALYYLWITGRLMIHSRERSERRYDLTERLVPPRLLQAADATEAEAHLWERAIHTLGLPDSGELGMVCRMGSTKPPNGATVRDWVREMERREEILPVEVDGWRGKHWVDPEGVAQLKVLGRGSLPQGWDPLGATTEEEATFLAPLEIVSARGRSRKLFDFEYLWEVYKPAPARRWGYYTLPILHGDRLRARADLRYERASGTLRVLGFWLEEPEDAREGTLARAIGLGLGRLRDMTGGGRVDARPVRPAGLRAELVAAALPSGSPHPRASGPGRAHTRPARGGVRSPP